MLRALLIPAAALLASACATSTCLGEPSPSYPTDWMELKGPSDTEVPTTIEALGMMQRGSEGWLHVESLQGRAKFLPNTMSEPDARPLAYEISVKPKLYDQASALNSEIPDPHRQRKPEEVFGASYAVYLEFTLRDKEGFALARLRSDEGQEAHQIVTHKTKADEELFKGVTTNAVSAFVAAGTASVDAKMVVFRVMGITDENTDAPE